MREYLSHGVYADYDPITKRIKLTTEAGVGVDNVIYIYSLVHRDLMAFIKRVGEKGLNKA